LQRLFSERFGRIDLQRRKLLGKIGMILLLIIACAALYLACLGVEGQNRKMMKLNRNEANLLQQNKALKNSAKQFARSIFPLEAGADLEKIKTRYINDVMNVLKQFNLKVDSYRSEVAAEDGFQLFKYNVSVLGDFIDVIRFFNTIGRRMPFLFVRNYNIKLHGEKFVRMDLMLDIVGEVKATP
jgi:hypothetical protein